MPTELSRVAVILTTWNSERFFESFPIPLLSQGIRPDQVLIVDSESKDNTVARARSFGFQVHAIPRCDFNHGGTRAEASALVPWAEILVYSTPDAIMAGPDTLTNLVRVFDDPEIGAAFGRQLPHKDADIYARHACEVNYPDRSVIRDYGSRGSLGFKVTFLSNNLGAYRRTALEAVGNFPSTVITAEDMCVSAKMMLAGWKTAYVADAAVYHSHNQRLSDIFRRYFDTGVMHVREKWLIERYGEPSGDGSRFVRSELRYVWNKQPYMVADVILRTAVKFIAYKIGRREASLPVGLKRHIGNFKEFWNPPADRLQSARSTGA